MCVLVAIPSPSASPSGSVKRIKALSESLEDDETGGSRRADLDEYDVHTVGGVLKRTLIGIEPPLVLDKSVSSERPQRSNACHADFSPLLNPLSRRRAAEGVPHAERTGQNDSDA